MGKITYVKIAGKNYPMSFSLGATKRLISKYGSVEKMQAKISKPGKDEEKLDAIIEILGLLISQGCAYKNYFEKDMPVTDDDPVIEGKWTPLPAEAIEVAIDVFDADEIAKAIKECIEGGSKKDVEAKPDKKMPEPLQD